MLANGIKLGYKKHGTSGDYTDIPGLKEVPELGNVKEKVENSALSDDTMQYEFGIGDPGDLDYIFRYLHDAEKAAYRTLRAESEANSVLDFCETFPDGTKYEFTSQIDIRMGGGSVNGVIDWTLSMALQSKIGVTDPA